MSLLQSLFLSNFNKPSPHDPHEKPVKYAQERNVPRLVKPLYAELYGHPVSQGLNPAPLIETAIKPLKRRVQKMGQIQEMGLEDLTGRLTRIEKALEAYRPDNRGQAAGEPAQGLTAEQSHNLIVLADSIFYISKQSNDPKTLRIIEKRVEATLEAFGVSILPLSGIPFNDKCHEAKEGGHDEEKPNNWILETLRPGYVFRDRLLRPAWVIVNQVEGGR